MTNRWLGLGSLVLVVACNAVIGDSGGGRGDPSVPGEPGEPTCGRSVCGATGELASGTAFPRLTHAQWENSVRDLLRLDTVPNASGSFEPDTRISFFDNNSRALRVSGDLWSDYQGAAEALAESVTADASSLARLLPANLPTACARSCVTSDAARSAERCTTRSSRHTPCCSRKARRIFRR